MMTDKKPGLLKRMFPSLSVGKFSSEETTASFDGVVDEDDDDSCPSYKSVVINPASSAANQFFDSEQKKMVEIDNFSFDQDVNHFETRSGFIFGTLFGWFLGLHGSKMSQKITDIHRCTKIHF